ncbi:MAG: hypothetical protein ACTSUU_07220, partial [Candidatus Thorarchaeota archaeon]
LINVTQSRKDGFLKIYEWKGFSFEEVWSVPHEYVYWNPVTALMIDDQDYDSRQEIIVGHGKGFDLWEWNGSDSGYDNVEIITSSPNYPHMDGKPARLGDENNTVYTYRGQNDIAPIRIGSGGYFIDVYVDANSVNSPQPRIHYKIYDPVSGMWIPIGALTPPTYPQYPSRTVVSEADPAVFYDSSNGTLYVMWRARLREGSTDYYSFYMMKYNGTIWSSVQEVFSAYYFRWPKPFVLADGRLGVACMYTPNHGLYFYTTSSWSGSWSYGGRIDYKDYSKYFVDTFDLTRLGNGGWAVAISARNSSVAKTDLDIFVATTNASFVWQEQPLYKATSSYLDEILPDIGVLSAPENTLMVVYEVPSAPVEDRIQMSYSNNYMVWRKGEQLTSLPNYVMRVDNLDRSISYYHSQSSPHSAPLYVPSAYNPAVVGLPSGGFMYVYIFGFSVRNFYSIAGPVARFLDASNPYSGGGKLYNEHADLVYGINPSSRFVHYNVRGVADMDAGDTDNDGRREVIAGFDDKVGVYELEHSNLAGDEMQHKEKWVSNAFPYDVTGVTVYDMNGNGYEEIGVSAERGEVFVFEVDDSALPPVDLGFGEEVWTVSDAGSVWSDDIRNNRMVSCDIDDDGRQEIIMGMENGTIAAFDDDGDARLWSYSGVSSYVYVMDLENTTEGLRLAVSYGDGNYTFLNAVSGALLWRDVFMGYYFPGLVHIPGYVAIADIAPSPGPEVIATNSFSNMTVWASDGSILWTHSLGGATVFSMRIAAGNFSGRAEYDLVVAHPNGTITFVYGNNGTIIRHLEYSVASPWFSPFVFDYNDDGYDDIAIHNKCLAVLDGHTGDVLYNSTTDVGSGEWAYYLYISDYDTDSQPEAVIVTNKAVYYEEFSSGRQVWSYNPPAASILHASDGFFEGDGAGVALALEGGGLVALDALTGRVLWFDIEPHTYRAAVAVDIDGDGYDEIAGSLDNGTLYVVRRIALGYDSRPEVFEPWTTYWTGQYDSDVRGVWAYDLTGDSVDELVVADSGHLWVYDTKTMSLLWNASSLNCSILDVEFGDLDGDGNLDLLVYGRMRMGLSSVFALDGATGTSISTIDHTFSDDVAGILVGNFLTSVDGDEYVVVMTESSPTNTYAVCFSEGKQRFVTNVNMTQPVADIAVGEFDGSAGLDFVVAAGTVVTFYSGQCVRQHYYLTGTSVDDIAVGDFDNNGIDDAIASTDWSVRTINASTNSDNFWIASWSQPITFVETGDWDPNTGALEVAVGLTGGDIIVGQGDALNWFGAWDSGSFMGPARMRYAKVGGTDVAVLAVGHSLIAWNPQNNDTLVYYSGVGYVEDFVVAEFDGVGTADFAYHTGTRAVVVTNGTRPSTGGGGHPVVASDLFGLGVTLAGTVGGVPLLVGVAILVVRRRRRVVS